MKGKMVTSGFILNITIKIHHKILRYNFHSTSILNINVMKFIYDTIFGLSKEPTVIVLYFDISNTITINSARAQRPDTISRPLTLILCK
jgi:hypothetical protein